MSTFKPNIEAIISEMVNEIDFFGAKRADCMAINSTKWQLPQRTFDRYWKEATTRYQEATERKNAALEDIRIEMEKERLKSAILTKHERMEILSQIAKGEIPLTKHIVCDGIIQEVEVVPAWKDRRDAVAELNKMEGDYAPIKKDITSGGEPLKQITGIIVE